ncbi:phosphoglycerate mutase-like protein [Dothidotthia symphoricarpi CBS 119687]|uniref:Phosphoglycerate mutase-like protein n=1 Tax=Dothidotthia symphoricarpi CBS 119687 TaxID=1392245 RepID=A0A6A6ABX8_9PLEO|nr:phosphoglycerate mutase-like protein [Dothidotthia symphoricarpi CBS 119687]KAF2128398.1 phosphoglycerate mutase-like protein [Dothidotthia symphoricarpi CBS 119687]
MKSAITLSLLAGAEAADTLLGAYVFHRHGDRSPKALAPTHLTTLGYEQVYTSGEYYRTRYLNSSSTAIMGISADEVKLSQLAITAPVDNVLQNSAMGFLQGLYPPVHTVQTLANGNSVQAPLDGYQLIPINTVQTNAGSEDSGWLQDASSCQSAKTSSNSYFESKDYTDLLASTKDVYAGVVDEVNGTFTKDQVSFKNAYIVYDLLNVASIHNSTTLTPAPTLSHLRTLADAHEWGLAYNATDTARAIAGKQLAGEILTALNSTITSRGTTPKLAFQFGAYATFMSFFGLAGLPAASENFTGVVDYASSMALELFTAADVSAGSWPAEEDMQVRFLFHNNSASAASPLATFPLFGGSAEAVSWADFKGNLSAFSVSTTQEWCAACANTTGSCAAFASSSSTAQASGGKKGGVSPAVGGVIGACVTLAVVLGALAAAMLVGGFRVAKKGKGVVGEKDAVKA